MTGKIKGISGPTVDVEIKGVRLYERVFVGDAMLTGEVVRLEQERAVVQVYESTRGLGLGEPVRATGTALTVRLGPGLLSQMFDGLHRPLSALREETGNFISSGKETPALDFTKIWEFHPLKKAGDGIKPYEILGYVEEGAIRHFISCGNRAGTIAQIIQGGFSLDRPVCVLEDGRQALAWHDWPVRIPRRYAQKFSPSAPLITGQRSIDFLFPLAKGGAAVFPGGFGTGKTVLEQAIAKFAQVEIVIYVGCGERGNEMAELIDDFLNLSDPWSGKGLMQRTIVVVNTSNMPVAAREASIYTGATIAEYYRDMGYNVLLLADSLSRWAEALREISSSLEEMPGEEGYPTYLFSRIAGFVERAGAVETLSGKKGSLSFILSVSPPGADFTEPVTQSCLRTAGAFLMLDTALAHRRQFPAINWLQSYSLYEKDIAHYFGETVSPDWDIMKKRCREILQKEEALREVAEIVGIEGLQDADRLLMHTAEKVRYDFLAQNAFTKDAFSPPEKTLARIQEIVRFYDNAAEKLKAGALLEEVLR